MDMNITQPLVVGPDTVLISSEASNGASLLRIQRDGDKYTIEPVWKTKHLTLKFSSPVVHQGNIYGLSYGILTCIDPATGRSRWKDGHYGHGQILLIDDVILVLSESGDVALVSANPDEYRERAVLRVFSPKTWNTPAVAGNQLFIRTHEEMACFELPEKK